MGGEAQVDMDGPDLITWCDLVILITVSLVGSTYNIYNIYTDGLN